MSTAAEILQQVEDHVESKMEPATGGNTKAYQGVYDNSKLAEIVDAVVASYPESEGFSLQTDWMTSGANAAGEPNISFAWARIKRGSRPGANIQFYLSGTFRAVNLDLPEALSEHVTLDE